MTQELPDKADAGAEAGGREGAGGSGRGAGRPSVLVIAVLVLASLVVIAVVLTLVGLATGDRLGGARGVSAPSPAAPRDASSQARRAGGGASVPRDKSAQEVAAFLTGLAEIVEDRVAAADEEEEVEEDAELAEKLRETATLFSGNLRDSGADLPDDLELPEESRVVMVGGGPPSGQALVLALVPGGLAAAREFFVKEAEARRWTCTEQPSQGGPEYVTLWIAKPVGARMITIRRASSGDGCTVGVYDF